MIQDLSFYNAVARNLLANDEERDELYAKIDQAANAEIEMPEELRSLSWIGERKFASTAAADAVNAAIRTYAARLPDFSISPVYDTPEEYELTERMELAMGWDFERMNMKGSKSPHWQIVESCVKYCAAAIQTEYLPWMYSDVEKTMRVKSILRRSNCNWVVHHPGSVHSQETNGTLERVLLARVYSAQEILDLFGTDNEGIRQMLMEVGKEDPDALQGTYYSFYDYTDWEVRAQWILKSDSMGSLEREPDGGIELLIEERKVPFIPWIVVDNKEPILKTLVNSGLYDNLNILRTMQFSKAVDQVAHPEYWIATPDGTLRGVSIDNTNPNQPLVTTSNVQVNQLRPPMLDPQLAQLEAMAESEAFRTTVAQILASVEKYASSQNFSVVNAMINAALSQLALSQMAVERAEEEAFYQNFQWIEFSEIPMAGYRKEEKGEHKRKGGELSIKSGEFDLEYLYITVKLNPNTITDEQMKVNNVVNKVERLGMSLEMAWDELGMKNYKLNEAKKTEEDFYTAHVQAKQKEILMRPEMEAQQAAAQAEQAQANPEATANQMNAPASTTMQGADPRAGMMPTGQMGM